MKRCLAVVLMLAGCASSGLVGSWTGNNGALTLVFGDDGKASIISTTTDSTTQCSTTTTLNGTWRDTSSGTTNSFSFSMASGSLETKGCIDTSKNVANTTLDPTALSAANAQLPTTETYVVTGTALTLTSTVNGTTSSQLFTRT